MVQVPGPSGGRAGGGGGGGGGGSAVATVHVTKTSLGESPVEIHAYNPIQDSRRDSSFFRGMFGGRSPPERKYRKLKGTRKYIFVLG